MREIIRGGQKDAVEHVNVSPMTVGMEEEKEEAAGRGRVQDKLIWRQLVVIAIICNQCFGKSTMWRSKLVVDGKQM